MWRSPLPLVGKLRTMTSGGSEVARVTGAIEPVAEPDPGRFEVPHRVDAACAASTDPEILPSLNVLALQKGGRHGTRTCPVCGPRRAQGDGRGMHTSAGCPARRAQGRDENIQDDATRV